MSIRLHAGGVVEQVAIALSRYDWHMRRLVEAWPDMDLYSTVSSEMDEVRSLAFYIPTLSVPLCELIISHAEVIAALGAPLRSAVPQAGLAAACARHRDVVARLRGRCTLLGAAPAEG